MKINRFIAPLIRASLDQDLRSVRSITMKILRSVKYENPALANEISEALEYNGSGFSTARSLGFQNTPKDSDSRSELLNIEEPLIDQYLVFDNHISRLIETINDERVNMRKLISIGLTPTSSILLYGEPGVGKTMLAKLLASRFKLKFASLDMSSAVSSYLGRTGQNLKKAIDYAKYEPTLLLLDEFDAIAKKRDDITDLGELKRVVNVLLKELEEWPTHSILVAATNHPELLDRAIWRRFDISIEIPKPDINVRTSILTNNLNDFIDEKDTKVIAKIIDGFSPADIVKICNKSKKRAVLYDEGIMKSMIEEIGYLSDGKSLEFNKLFSRIAHEMGFSYREIGALIGKSKTSVQNYIRGGKK